MLLTNKMSFDWYIEKYKSIKINISATSNSGGILYVDEFNNSLYSTLNVGVSVITKIVGYSSNYQNSLLIYDDNTFTLCRDYVTKGTNKFYPIIHPNLPVKYKINAKSDKILNSDDSTFFALNLTGRNIFKVRLNNAEILNYTASSTGITVNQVLDPFENELEVIHYSTNQTITTPFYLTYEGVEVRYNLETKTCDSTTFFDNMTFIEVFNDLSDSINKTLVNIGNSRDTNEEQIMTDLENSITLNLPNGRFDLQDIVEDKPFRLVAYAPMEDIFIYWNNCKISNGITFTVGTDTNNLNTSINFYDRVIVYGNSPVNEAYGSGLYGVGLYGLRTISSNFGTKLY